MDKEIINKYQSGYSISKILLEYPQYNRRQINKMLKDANIVIRGGRKKKDLTPLQLEEAQQMINNGAFLKELAEYFKMDTETMKNLLNNYGLVVSNTNRINRQIKNEYFSTIDAPEKAYWLGLLFTDGCVDKYRKTGRIRIQLQERDKEILEKFREDLNIKSKIIYDIRPNSTCCSVEFVSDQIFNDLGIYGIIPNKTYNTCSIPYDKIPTEYWPSFALGLFDGDGNFSCSSNFSTDVTIGFTAYHEQEVKDFQTLINLITNLNTSNKVFFTSAWHTNWRGRLQVLRILDVLYSQSPRFLNRKHELYLQLKNSLN